MSDHLSEINLEFLMNKEQYGKYLYNKNQPDVKNNNRKDKKFYKKRIYDLTKQLLNNQQPDVLFPDVKQTFDNYIKSCIEYFKALDTTDIIQEDYNDMIDTIDSLNKIADINVDDINNAQTANKLMMRSIKIIEPNALEKLVIRTTTKCVKEPIIPKQKEINLTDPILKNKGICKKKNINNKYDENIISETNIQKK